MDELLLRNASVLEAVVPESDNLDYERLRGVVTSTNKVLTLYKECEQYFDDCVHPKGMQRICDCRGDRENKALFLRGKAYRAMGRFDDALDDFYKIENFCLLQFSWYKLDDLQMKASLETVKVVFCRDVYYLILV